MTDLLQRLRAADPIHEAPVPPPVEPLLARLDEPVADTLPGTRGRRALAPSDHSSTPSRAPAAVRGPSRRRRPLTGDPSSRRRTGARRLVAIPALVALLTLAGVVGLAQRPSPDVVAQAREALGTPGEIIHMITRMDVTTSGIENHAPPLVRDRDGRPLGHMSNRNERWTALDPLRERSRSTIVPDDGGAPHTLDFTFADGVTEVRQSWTDEVQTERFSQADYESVRGELSPGRPGADPVAGVRKLLADGKLTAAGEETLDGRRVLRLTAEEPSPNRSVKRPFPPRRIEYLVDATTYAPVRITYDDVIEDADDRVGTLRRVLTFEVFERLPLTPENEALLRQPEGP